MIGPAYEPITPLSLTITYPYDQCAYSFISDLPS